MVDYRAVIPAEISESGGKPRSSSWVAVGEASDLLEVSPSTLRRWTEKRLLPARKTAGGHRRYSRDVIEGLARNLGKTERSLAISAGPGALPLEWGFSRERLKEERWYPKLAQPESVAYMRSLGQRLLGLLIQHIARREEVPQFLREALQIGVQYGRHSAARGISLRETVDAFLFFRKSFTHTAFQLPAMSRHSDVEQILRLTQTTDEFMDAVLSGIAQGYDSSLDAPPSADARSETDSGEAGE